MDDLCPICGRPMPEITCNTHHLVPDTFGGKETITLHRICHNQIHAVFTERELQHEFNTVEKLLEHGAIQKFVKWVAKKDPYFYEKTRDSRERRKKRKR